MPELRLRADLAHIPPYVPGRAAPEGFKISANENPYAPLPSVIDAITDTLGGFNRYPAVSAGALVSTLAERFDVQPRNIVLGAGSIEILSQLIRATSGQGDEVVFAWRSFEAYPMLVRAAGATPVPVPLTAEHAHDLEAMLAAITPQTRFIIVCNPNNPTGTTIGAAALRAFLHRVPSDIVVLIDEAYVHFNERADSPVGIDFFREFDNVAVAHTFSKAYGLAGMRIGYGIAPDALADAMRMVAVPFGVTELAHGAAVASLAVEGELDERVTALVAERERVVAALAAAGWSLPETQTNFLWWPLGADTAAAAEVFEQHGLIVRAFAGEGLRATIAEVEANDLLLVVASELVGRGLTGGLVAPVGAVV